MKRNHTSHTNGLVMEVAAMPRRNAAYARSGVRRHVSRKPMHAIARLSIIWIFFLMVPSLTFGEPLEYSPRWSMGFEAMLGTIEGSTGFDQQNAGYGTLNDLKADLGLPNDNRRFKIQGSVRPLEHHLLRAFGTIPEAYIGYTQLNKDLRLTRLPNTTTNGQTDYVVTIPMGSFVHSEMKYATFGMGYDLDFLVAPRWAAGISGELRYLDLKFKMWGVNARNEAINNNSVPPILDPSFIDGVAGRYENVINIDELFPCVGGQANAALPIGMNGMSGLNIGGFTKMIYGLSPNYLNYVDIAMGLSVWTAPSSRMQFMAKVGIEHESVFHDAAIRNGRVFELKRNGLLFSLDGTF